MSCAKYSMIEAYDSHIMGCLVILKHAQKNATNNQSVTMRATNDQAFTFTGGSRSPVAKSFLTVVLKLYK